MKYLVVLDNCNLSKKYFVHKEAFVKKIVEIHDISNAFHNYSG